MTSNSHIQALNLYVSQNLGSFGRDSDDLRFSCYQAECPLGRINVYLESEDLKNTLICCPFD